MPFSRFTTSIGKRLARAGFRHADWIEPGAEGRYQAEIFPHAGCVQLFGLDRILKYKKGRVAERREGLERLLQLLVEGLAEMEPRAALGGLPPVPAAGGAVLKRYEDQLDAVLCGYLGAFWWYWGFERNEVLGNARDGYIVVPLRNAGTSGGSGPGSGF